MLVFHQKVVSDSDLYLYIFFFSHTSIGSNPFVAQSKYTMSLHLFNLRIRAFSHLSIYFLSLCGTTIWTCIFFYIFNSKTADSITSAMY